MKTIQVRLPDHIHSKMKELAREMSISLNNFIVSSISHEVIRQETRDFFKQAAAHYNPEDFAEVLSLIPDKPIPETDKL